MPNALRFRQWKTPKQNGERARLKIVHGPDQGNVFVITSDRFSIGRGDENDVIFSDLRASRRHAEVEKLASGHWRLRDLGSQNGVVWNGTVTREADMKSGDVLTVGETAFEFITEESGTQILHAPAKKLPTTYLAGGAPAAKKAVAAASAPTPAAAPSHGIAGLSGLSGIAGMGDASGVSGGSDPAATRKKVLFGVVAALAVWMFLDDGEKKPSAKGPKVTQKKDPKEVERDLASYLPPSAVGTGYATADSFFREGFREFREKNYLRARLQFETAIQINPAHGMALNYLKQADRAIADEVQKHIDLGRRDLDAGKLKSARGHFEAVQRLLARDTENPLWIEAKDQLRIIDIKSRGRMGGNG